MIEVIVLFWVLVELDNEKKWQFWGAMNFYFYFFFCIQFPLAPFGMASGSNECTNGKRFWRWFYYYLYWG